VLWIMYPILYAENLGDLAGEIKRRKLFLFDVWAYVPGSGPGWIGQQFQPPAGVFELLESNLGERWLGTVVGEYTPNRHRGKGLERKRPDSGIPGQPELGEDSGHCP